MDVVDAIEASAVLSRPLSFDLGNACPSVQRPASLPGGRRKNVLCRDAIEAVGSGGGETSKRVEVVKSGEIPIEEFANYL